MSSTFANNNIQVGLYDIDETNDLETGETKSNEESKQQHDSGNDIVIYSNVDKTSHLFKLMILQQEVLNRRIGTQAWKKYLSAAFWNYITTPINFSITLLTAIATGQAATSNILSQQQTLIILFVTFVLTTTNSFFKLNTKMNLNFEAARRYYSFGSEFERIYYAPLYADANIVQKLRDYESLHKNINKYMVSETIENQNYVTEFIYLMITWTTCCNSFGNISEWIYDDDKHGELDGKTDLSIRKKLKNIINTNFGMNKETNEELLNNIRVANRDTISKIESLNKSHSDEILKYQRMIDDFTKKHTTLLNEFEILKQNSNKPQLENRVVWVKTDDDEKDEDKSKVSPVFNEPKIDSVQTNSGKIIGFLKFIDNYFIEKSKIDESIKKISNELKEFIKSIFNAQITHLPRDEILKIYMTWYAELFSIITKTSDADLNNQVISIDNLINKSSDESIFDSFFGELFYYYKEFIVRENEVD